jgi:hypothetical protein
MKRLRRPDRILFLIASDNTTGKKLIRHAAWKPSVEGTTGAGFSPPHGE